MKIIWFIIFFITFLVSIILTKIWIAISKRDKRTVKDVNKFNKPLIPYSGGVAVISAFILGIFLYVGVTTFYFSRSTTLIRVLGIASTILITMFIGFLDDNLGGWRVGFKRWQKPLLTLPAALPLMAIKAGHSIMYVPFLGRINLGLLYPLILIPIGIIGASQGFNMLAGLNGLTVGNAIIIITTLSYIAWRINHFWVTIIGLIMVSALVGFLIFNKYKSKVFEGDVLLYPLGAFIASMVILGNIEKIGLILFIPYFIELVIKLKNRLKSECFLEPNEDGTLKYPEKIGSLTHVVARILHKIKGKIYEKDIVLSLWLFQLILALISILI